MGIKHTIVMPDTQVILNNMGEQIRDARLRRGISAVLVSERACISRATLYKIEKGDPTVAIGLYANVLHAIQGMDRDFLLIANDKEYIKTMQELHIGFPPIRRRQRNS